jgi:hypothetical protein
VCNYNWDLTDARVVCRQLGYLGVLKTRIQSDEKLGKFRAPIWWANVRCTGGELRLEDCSKDNWTEHTCDHSDDVVLECLPEKADAAGTRQNERIRLADGNSTYSGRVEVQFGKFISYSTD